MDNAADKVASQLHLVQGLTSEERAGEAKASYETAQHVANEKIEHMGEQLKEQVVSYLVFKQRNGSTCRFQQVSFDTELI